MPVHRRAAWEFYAVLEGIIVPLFERKAPVHRFESTLWVFAPRTAHGWSGERGQPCRIAVFHFLPVPKDLERRVAGIGGLRVTLTADECVRLSAMAEAATRRLLHPDRHAELHAERTLLELTLLVLERGQPFEENGRDAAEAESGVDMPLPGEEPRPPGAGRVVSAEQWFRNHLGQRPSTEQVATACGLSTAHLRRLFCRMRGASPKAVFSQIRLDVAKQILAHTDRTLDDIAEECGFASASAFCQAFKVATGMTPTVWRHSAHLQFCDHRPSPLRCDVERSLAGGIIPGDRSLGAW